MKKKKNRNTKVMKTSLDTTSILLILFIVLKLCGVIDWSWLWVLSPLWISAGISVSIIALVGTFIALLCCAAGISKLVEPITSKIYLKKFIKEKKEQLEKQYNTEKQCDTEIKKRDDTITDEQISNITREEMIDKLKEVRNTFQPDSNQNDIQPVYRKHNNNI